MKKITINAYSFDEAKQKSLEQGVTIVKNVTRTFKKEGPYDFEEFANKMIEKHGLKNSPDKGCVVVMDPGVPNERKRPYECTINKHVGRSVKTRMFELRAEDGTLIAATNTKADALRIAKDAICKIKKDIVCNKVIYLDNEHSTAFSLKYVPSERAKLGTYIVFTA